jgi:hypothetical protein
MRTLRRAFTILVLTFTLTLSTFAGDISTTVVPPSASAQGDISTTVNGDIQNGVAGDMPNGSSEAAADDSVAAVLGLVESVLSLL